MTSCLYLVVEKDGRYGLPRIGKVCRRRPKLLRPSEQTIVKLSIDIPNSILEPRVVNVSIAPEHVVRPAVTVNSVSS